MNNKYANIEKQIEILYNYYTRKVYIFVDNNLSKEDVDKILESDRCMPPIKKIKTEWINDTAKELYEHLSSFLAVEKEKDYLQADLTACIELHEQALKHKDFIGELQYRKRIDKLRHKLSEFNSDNS